MPTFADLGIDLPLFAADVSEASGWSPEGRCVVCSQERAGFDIGIGGYVAIECASCRVTTYASADGRAEPCHACGQPVSLDTPVEDEHGCWRCLADGRWAGTVDTEAGMVTPLHALSGRTNGVPVVAMRTWAIGTAGDTEINPDTDTPTTVAGWPGTQPDDGGWSAAIIPAEVLQELVRTPSYSTWQGECWRFHCGRAMTFVGPWGADDFRAASPDGDGAASARAIADINDWAWEGVAPKPAADASVGVYMFRCATCGEHRGHWDTT